MKFVKVGSIIVLAFILFSGGYLTGIMTSEKATKEIRIEYENREHEGQINYTKTITDVQNQGIIDHFLMIYLYSKQTNEVTIDKDNPDLYISLLSPKQSTGLIDSKVWFTTEGAIIGKRSGESWEQVEYSIINQDDADFIKKQAENPGLK